LNSGSSLRYPVRFAGDIREVFLTGEGFFEVTKDEERPFVVKTEEVDVRVLGTSFNVNAYPDEKVVATTLVEGKVRVGYGSKNFDLDPGMQFVYDREDKTANVRTVDMELYTSWKDGYYYFKQESLERIMDVLAKWYNLNVFFQNPELKNMEFGGRLKRYEDISYLLEKMEETQDVQFIIHGNTIIIKRKTD
jgi:transmembrane sensor